MVRPPDVGRSDSRRRETVSECRDARFELEGNQCRSLTCNPTPAPYPSFSCVCPGAKSTFARFTTFDRWRRGLAHLYHACLWCDTGAESGAMPDCGERFGEVARGEAGWRLSVRKPPKVIRQPFKPHSPLCRRTDIALRRHTSKFLCRRKRAFERYNVWTSPISRFLKRLPASAA